MSEGGASVQARFTTREVEFSVPNEPIAIETDVTPEQLTALINELLERQEVDRVEFEFLINENIIQGTLKDHIEEYELGTENIVEIEYIEKCPCPEPVDSLLHDDWVSSVHCAQIGNRQLILTGSYDCTVAIWTVAGKKLITLPGHEGPVKSVRWIDFDGHHARFVSTSHDANVLLWRWHVDKNTIDAVITCKGHERSADCVDVHLKGKRFATSGFDNVVKLWSISTEETELDIKKSGGDASAEGGASKKKIRTTDKAKGSDTQDGAINGITKFTRTPLVSLASHTEAVTALKFMNSSEMLTCSMDCTLKLWDIEVGGFSNNLLGSKAFLDLSYSPLNGNIVTGHADRHIRMWDPRSNQGSVVKCNFTSHVGWVSSVCWSPNISTQFISGSYDTILKLWDTRSTKAPLYDMEGHENKVLSCDWSIPELMVSGGADNKLKIFKHTAPKGKVLGEISNQPM